MGNSHVIVTGASRGIGRSIALRYANAGWTVWAPARSQEQLQSLADEAPAGTVKPVVFDASKPTEVEALAARLAKEATDIRALVNNAGVASSAPLAKTTLAEHERMFAINVTTPYLLCREIMPRMALNGGGRVVNIASTAALKGFKYTSLYCASKHALLGLTRALAVEYASKSVTVNAVCPGWTDTDMLKASADNISKATGRSEDEARQTLARMNPMGRLIKTEEVAELVWFLTTADAGAVITGAAYSIDGGEAAA